MLYRLTTDDQIEEVKIEEKNNDKNNQITDQATEDQI